MVACSICLVGAASEDRQLSSHGHTTDSSRQSLLLKSHKILLKDGRVHTLGQVPSE